MKAACFLWRKSAANSKISHTKNPLFEGVKIMMNSKKLLYGLLLLWCSAL